MKLNTIISSTAALLIGASVAFAMESKPAEPAQPAREHMEQVGKSADSVIKAIGGSQMQSLKKSFSGNKEATSLLDKTLSSFKAGKDSNAIAALNKLSGVKMSEGQKQIFSELKQNASVFALGQSFDTSDPAVSGPVNNAIAAVRTGDHISAAKHLHAVSELASISPEQKQLLAEVMLQYKGVDVDGLKNAGKAASGIMDMVKQ